MLIRLFKFLNKALSDALAPTGSSSYQLLTTRKNHSSLVAVVLARTAKYLIRALTDITIL